MAYHRAYDSSQALLRELNSNLIQALDSFYSLKETEYLLTLCRDEYCKPTTEVSVDNLALLLEIYQSRTDDFLEEIRVNLEESRKLLSQMK